MYRSIRPYVGRTVVVNVDGEPLRGVLHSVGKDCMILTNAEGADGATLDGVIIVPLPTVVQVV